MGSRNKDNSENREGCSRTRNVVKWFMIPALDFERAVGFYSRVFGAALRVEDWGELRVGIFPHDEGAVSGAVVQGGQYVPSDKGSIVYLDGGEDLNVVLRKVEAAGGKVLRAKFRAGEHDYIAFFLDTEGNRVALHSWK